MRTTLTLEDDVAALLRSERRRRQVSFKRLVNDALREGLGNLGSKASPCTFGTRSVSLGRSLVGDLDDVSEVLAVAEGEHFR